MIFHQFAPTGLWPARGGGPPFLAKLFNECLSVHFQSFRHSDAQSDDFHLILFLLERYACPSSQIRKNLMDPTVLALGLAAARAAPAPKTRHFSRKKMQKLEFPAAGQTAPSEPAPRAGVTGDVLNGLCPSHSNKDSCRPISFAVWWAQREISRN